MTREQIDAIRAVLAECRRLGWTTQLVDDAHALLAEVERLTALTEAINPCRLIDVGDDGVSRKRAEADAFSRGVAAMREAAIEWAWRNFVLGAMASVVVRDLRALPDPEDK